MSSFQPKYLSDEDIARLLDQCSTTELVLERKKNGFEVWRCPMCGARALVRERQNSRIHVSMPHPVGGIRQVYA